MLIFFYIIKHIITHKNKILYNFFMYYLLPTIKKVKKDSNPYSNFYIYYLKIYMITLRFSFYEPLQDQC